MLKWKFIVFLVFITAVKPGIAQEPVFVDTLNHKENRLAELLREKGKMEKEASKLSNEIARLKSKENLNRFQHSTLEDFLREAESLAQALAALNREIEEKREGFYRFIEKRTLEIDNEIRKTLERLENTNKKSRQKGLFGTIKNLREERQQLREKLPVELLIAIRYDEIEITPDDTPEEIREKADALKDTEDKFRFELTLIDQQITEIQDEADLRERMNEFLKDVAFFDEADLLVDDDPVNPSRNAEGLRASADFATSENSPDEEKSQFDVDLQTVQLLETNIPLPINLDTQTFEELEDWLQFLKKQQELLLKRADELAQKADTYYQKAKELDLKEPE